MNNEKLNLNQIGEIIGDANFAEHQAEAQEQFGSTDDWAISEKRTSTWTTADWAANKQRFEQIETRLVEAVQSGTAPDSPEAAELVEAHRAVLSEFFPVTHAKHYLISRGYVTDQRFKHYYDSQQEGLVQWLAEAIAHVAQDHGVDLDNPDWS